MDNSEFIKYAFTATLAIGLFILKIVFDFAKDKPQHYKSFMAFVKPVFVGSYLIFVSSFLTVKFIKEHLAPEVANTVFMYQTFFVVGILGIYLVLKIIDLTARKWGESEK